jgi:hypothetical protein
MTILSDLIPQIYWGKRKKSQDQRIPDETREAETDPLGGVNNAAGRLVNRGNGQIRTLHLPHLGSEKSLGRKLTLFGQCR